jgi:hypothetical protein
MSKNENSKKLSPKNFKYFIYNKLKFLLKEENKNIVYERNKIQ